MARATLEDMHARRRGTRIAGPAIPPAPVRADARRPRARRRPPGVVELERRRRRAWPRSSRRGSAPPAAVVAAMALAIGASQALLTFPLDVVAGFLLPRRAGLLTQSFGSWLGDRAKALADRRRPRAARRRDRLRPAPVEPGPVVALGERRPRRRGSCSWRPRCRVWLIPLFYRLTPLDDPAPARPDPRPRRPHAGARRGGRRRGLLAQGADRERGRGRPRAHPADPRERHAAPRVPGRARSRWSWRTSSATTPGATWRRGSCSRASSSSAPCGPSTGPSARARACSGLTGPADPAGLPFLALVLTAARAPHHAHRRGVVAPARARGRSRRPRRQRRAGRVRRRHGAARPSSISPSGAPGGSGSSSSPRTPPSRRGSPTGRAAAARLAAAPLTASPRRWLP